MQDEQKTKAQLLDEVRELRERVGKLESMEPEQRQTSEELHRSEELAEHRAHFEDLVDESAAELKQTNEQLRLEIAERKSAEAALRQGEQRYRTILQTALDGFWVVDMEGRILEVNRSYCEMLGYSRGELLRMYIHDIEEAEDPEETAAHIERIRENGHDRFTTRHRRKDGNIIDVEISATYPKEGAGQFVVFLRDITERRRADETLRESEKRYRMLVENMNDGLGIQDEKGLITFVNDAFSKMVGYSPDELVGHPVADYIAPDHRDSFSEQAARRRIGENAPYETVFLRKDGRMVYTLVSPQAVVDAEGRFIGSFALMKDVTERKRVEDTLLLHSAILENMSEGVNLVRVSDQLIVYANPKFESMFGYSSGELISKHVSILNAPIDGDPDSTAASVVQKLEEDGRWSGEFHNVKADGTAFWTRASVAPLYNSDLGQVWICVQEDITERRQAQERLSQSEAKYRRLIENLPQRIFHKDAECVYVSCNARFAEDLRIAPNQIEGKTDLDLYPEEIAEKHREDDRRIMASGQLEELEEFYVVDGQKFTVQTVKTPLTDVAGNSVGILGIFWDITERKRAEEDLLRSREELRNLAAHLQSAREEERAELTREIHDGLGQMLTRLHLDLALIHDQLSNPLMDSTREKLLEQVDSMSVRIKEIVESTQRTAYRLRPSMLEDLGLLDAIDWEAKDWQSRTGLDCDLEHVRDDLKLPKDEALAIFRIFQEAMTNVHLHAYATRVKVSLERRRDVIHFSVIDDGRGIVETELDDPHSLGLIGMRERALLLGGELNIRGMRGKGTEVLLTFPLRRGARD